MADKGLGTRRLVLKAKNKEDLIEQLENLVTDKGKDSLIGHIKHLVCEKGKVVQCKLPTIVDNASSSTPSTFEQSANAEIKTETPQSISSRDDNPFQHVDKPVCEQAPEEKVTLRRFAYDSFLRVKDCIKVTYDDFMVAAHDFGANAEEASAQDLRGYFAHLSFICRMAATRKYDQEVHIAYDKAIRKQAEEFGWSVFKADNSTVANLFYDNSDKVSISEGAPVAMIDSDTEGDACEVTTTADDNQSNEQNVSSRSETLELQDVKEDESAKDTHKEIADKITSIKASTDIMWQSFTTVSTNPNLMHHKTQGHIVAQGTGCDNVPHLPRDVEITIVQPVMESRTSLQQKGKKRERSKRKSRKCTTSADQLSSADTKSSTSVERKRHFCPHCGKQFPRPYLLKDHLNTHTQEPTEIHICTYCGKHFGSAKRLGIHITIHTRDGPPVKKHLCSYCGKGFTGADSLRIHVRNHTGERPYSCSQCGKSFGSSAVLRHHMKTHTGSKEYICSYCGKQYASGYQLTVHVRTHTGEKPFICSSCGKGFTANRRLQIHMRSHTGEKPHKCSECGKGFPTSGNLHRHKLIHTGEKPHICQICGKGCSQLALLRDHILIWHSQERPHKCSHCGRTFKQKPNLKAHIKSWHSGEKPKRKPRNQEAEEGSSEGRKNPDRIHKCSECDKQYSYLSSLKVHMISHTENNPLACPECGKQCASNMTLRLHIMNHIQESPHQCLHCGKAYLTAATLDAHIRTHTGEKPFVCAECGKAFSLETNLHRHKKVHTGQKDFVCSYCGKAFGQKSNLQVHTKIHTGERPFVCAECGKGFSIGAYLRRHMKVHGEVTTAEQSKGVSTTELDTD